MLSRSRTVLVFTAAVSLLSPALAEDPTRASIGSMIGGYAFDSDHVYAAETWVHLPVLRLDPVSLSYRHHEFTPVLREGSQTQLLYRRDEWEANWSFHRHLRAILLGGQRHTALQDRPGSLDGSTFGGGLGSPLRRNPERFEWFAIAGGYLSRDRLDANWWTDLHLDWRAYRFPEMRMLDTPFRPSLGLAVDIDSVNRSDRLRAFYKAGPYLDFLSAHGNRLRFQARYFGNDGNPFLEKRSSGLLVGVEANASLDEAPLFDARELRPVGLLPLVWGQYDVGYGGDRSLQRTELTVEVHDLKLMDHILTPVLWYESRQEWRLGDFDNTSYTIGFGAQTRVGLASVLSRGQPLVFGSEYLHRSAHALDPDASRVPAGQVLPHNSINLFRVRLQTLGWDVPYRDPTVYEPKTAWVNGIDWRIALGYDFHHSRDRRNPAAQFGLNWDAATIQGYVIYARGLGSIGNETPDWLGEVGVRRRMGKLFFRFERYGLESQLARDNTAVIGLGFHL